MTCEHDCCQPPLLTPEDSRRLADLWAEETRTHEAERRRLLSERLERLDGSQVLDFSRRILADALLEATAAYWTRRAEQLEAARPRREDETGDATPTGIAARWDRLTAAAQACRNHATIAGVDVAAELERETAAVIDDFWRTVDPTGEGRARLALHRAGGHEAAA